MQAVVCREEERSIHVNQAIGVRVRHAGADIAHQMGASFCTVAHPQLCAIDTFPAGKEQRRGPAAAHHRQIIDIITRLSGQVLDDVSAAGAAIAAPQLIAARGIIGNEIEQPIHRHQVADIRILIVYLSIDHQVRASGRAICHPQLTPIIFGSRNEEEHAAHHRHTGGIRILQARVNIHY